MHKKFIIKSITTSNKAPALQAGALLLRFKKLPA